MHYALPLLLATAYRIFATPTAGDEDGSFHEMASFEKFDEPLQIYPFPNLHSLDGKKLHQKEASINHYSPSESEDVGSFIVDCSSGSTRKFDKQRARQTCANKPSKSEFKCPDEGFVHACCIGDPYLGGQYRAGCTPSESLKYDCPKEQVFCCRDIIAGIGTGCYNLHNVPAHSPDLVPRK